MHSHKVRTLVAACASDRHLQLIMNKIQTHTSYGGTLLWATCNLVVRLYIGEELERVKKSHASGVAEGSNWRSLQT